MSDEKFEKVLVRRPAQTAANDHGRAPGDDSVEGAELELVSTQMLKVMLTSRDATEREAIAGAANGSIEGVLARNPTRGSFEIIPDDELSEILATIDGLPKIDMPADATLEPLRDFADDDRLSLVSTRALRKVLDGNESEPAAKDSGLPLAESDSFNPYNHR